jgi:flagellar motor switch protein FliM
MINLCIPHVVIEPIMPRLSVHQWFASQKKTRAPEEQVMLEKRVSKATLPVVAELGSSHISVMEFLNLSVGDVIALHKSTDQGLEVKVGDKVKFIASPGTVRDKMAVQIHEIVDDEGEDNDDE